MPGVVLLFICNNRRISSSIKIEKNRFDFCSGEGNRYVPFRSVITGPNLSWPQPGISILQKRETDRPLCSRDFYIYQMRQIFSFTKKKKSKQILNQNYYRIEPKSSGLIPFPCTDSSNTGKPSCSCFVS